MISVRQSFGIRGLETYLAPLAEDPEIDALGPALDPALGVTEAATELPLPLVREAEMLAPDEVGDDAVEVTSKLADAVEAAYTCNRLDPPQYSEALPLQTISEPPVWSP